MGLVTQVFDEKALVGLRGDMAIGHTRYSTTGSSFIANAQPLRVAGPRGDIVLAHNGNLINTRPLRDKLEAEGTTFQTTTDSELMAVMIAQARAHSHDIPNAIRRVAAEWRGAYSTVFFAQNALFGMRDPYGVRPLVIGALNGSHYALASETCALNVVGARFLREVEPGELVMIDDKGLRSYSVIAGRRRAMCIFEFIYFARPDSHIYGKTLHTARQRMGEILAAEHPAEADVVIPVPDTGWPAAIGFARASGISFGEGLIKNRYIHRTFIEPDQRQRDLGVRMKLTPLQETLAGKRVVVVEDSIVRGTTTRNIINLIRDAGATAVHLRISSPPYRFPCFYGIDTFDRRMLLAARLEVEEIRDYLGADSLGYLSVEGLVRAIGLLRSKFCLACFDSRYPIPIPRAMKVSKFSLEEEEPASEES